MSSAGHGKARVAPFLLVGPHMSEAEALVAVIRRLSVARSLAEIMDVVTHAARALLEADGITFVLREGDLCHYADEDAIAPLWKGKRFPMSACISGWCMETGQAVAIADIFSDDRIPHDAYRPTFVRSLAMVPVRQEEPVAAMGAYWAEQRQVAAAELELLQTLANAASLAFAVVELRETRSSSAAAEVVPRLWERTGGWQLTATHGDAERAGWWLPLLVGVGLAAVAGALRLALSPLVDEGIPYLTFFLAVPVAALMVGRMAGAATAVAGGIIAFALFVRAPGQILPEGPQLWALLAFWSLAGLVVLAAAAVRRAVQREAAASRRLELVGQELQHRLKNFLAITQSLVLQSARSSENMGEFERKLRDRLQALGAAQALLAEGSSARATLAPLVRETLKPFRMGGRLEVKEGPEAVLDEQLALALALILNELATNAVKYGALSAPEGRVDLGWTVQRDKILLEWSERGGPEVAPPDRKGFGSRLIRLALPRSRGSVHSEYLPQGLRCRIEFAPAQP